MDETFTHDVFLSHSSKDKAIIRNVAERLHADGLRVWFDEWMIKPGDSIPVKIEEGLERSRVLVLCLSSNAYGSDWAQLEASTFRFRDPLNKNRRFIPLRLDDTPIKGSLAQFFYINWSPADCEREYSKLLSACRCEEPARSRIPETSLQLKAKIEEARCAARKHDDENAINLWEEARKQAVEEGDKTAEICARLQLSLIRLRSGSDLDEVLAGLDRCIQDAKDVELGENRTLLFQLLGEAHRVKGNPDHARGFIIKALEQSRSARQKGDEGWALLSLSVLGKAGRKSTEGNSELDLIQQAYDCFSSLYASGERKKQRSAMEGFAACHSLRAECFGHRQLDDAMAEYSRSLEIFNELGDGSEWDTADILFRRGELHARADDPQLAANDLAAAAELFNNLGDYIMEAECTLRFAELLDRRGLRLESKQYYQAAAERTMLQNNRKRSAWVWFRYACKLVELHEFDEATSIFSTLLKADWVTPGQRLDVLKNLCLIAKATGQKSNLERYSQAALEVIDDKIAKARFADERRKLIISKAHSLEELDEHDRALDCLRRAIKGFESISDLHGIVECWFHIGGIMGKMSKYQEEREAYERVLELADDKVNSFFLPLTLTMLAQLDISEKRFDDARKHLDRAEQENQTLNNPAVLLIGQELRNKLPAI